MKLKRIGLDTSKAVFTLHGVDADEEIVLRRDVRRADLEPFFARLPPALVALEACGSSHHWGRRLVALGHTVRLIPPQYVKPFVRRGKNDRNDAEAICEAASRPSMPTVPVRAAEQQADAIVLSARELLVRQRTQLINAVRGHAAEFGIVAAKNTSHLPALLEAVAADDAVPEAARTMLAFLGTQVGQLDERIAELDHRMKQQHKANPVSRRLAEIPGIGPVGALSLALTVDASRFRSGRHFVAWLVLTPKERSTGGQQRLGGISRAGNERLRQLLVVDAMAVIRFARPGSRSASGWLISLLERKPRKLAAVALANKMARIAWAMMASGKAYRGRTGAVATAAGVVATA